MRGEPRTAAPGVPDLSKANIESEYPNTPAAKTENPGSKSEYPEQTKKVKDPEFLLENPNPEKKDPGFWTLARGTAEVRTPTTFLFFAKKNK